MGLFLPYFSFYISFAVLSADALSFGIFTRSIGFCVLAIICPLPDSMECLYNELTDGSEL